MSYTPTEWKTGDIVSSQKLNKLEEGVKGAYEVMVINDTNGTIDKTWQEIHDAMAQGKLGVLRTTLEGTIMEKVVDTVSYNDGKYEVKALSLVYVASSATEYPKTGGLN